MQIWNYILKRRILTIISLILAFVVVIMMFKSLEKFRQSRIMTVYSSCTDCTDFDCTLIQFQNDGFCFIDFDSKFIDNDVGHDSYRYKWSKSNDSLFLDKAGSFDNKMPMSLNFIISTDTLTCYYPKKNYKLFVTSKFFEKDCIIYRDRIIISPFRNFLMILAAALGLT
jgi:hypothetical protein